MFHHRRDTPGYVPTTSSAQWSGYLRSTLAELAIKEPDDVEEEATSEQLTAEQLDQSDRERDASCSSGRYEQNRPGYVRSLVASRRDTPAYVYESNTRIKSKY
ncbi:uncharacterized protein [Porites lutea]|uniref:uncharacterized protein n=1 Tax=Porites lutea TaxID=51062 RepID=UPI003CC50211